MTTHACIDIHTHVVPEHFPRYAGRHVDVRWPLTEPAHACHRHVLLSGQVYRTVSDRCWDIGKRAEDMAAMRVGRQVLSPMPELLSYWLDPADGASLARFINEQIAEMVGRDSGRFFGLGTVPLQDPDVAVRELEHAMKVLGLSGVEIGTNVNGVVLGDPRLALFFEAAERLGAAVFVHPLRPVGMERLIGPPGLQQLLAFPGETGLSAASLLTSGLMSRFPKLRIAFSHGGGTLSALLPRLEHGWHTFDAVRDSMPAPLESARRMFYDSLVYDHAALRRVIECFGPSQVCVGSDFPFRISEPDPVGRIDTLDAEPQARRQLLQLNAERWLGVADHEAESLPGFGSAAGDTP